MRVNKWPEHCIAAKREGLRRVWTRQNVWVTGTAEGTQDVITRRYTGGLETGSPRPQHAASCIFSGGATGRGSNYRSLTDSIDISSPMGCFFIHVMGALRLTSSAASIGWACVHGVTIDFSRPGKPIDNPFIESFNGSLQDECLNIHWFLSLEDAQEKLDRWHREYKHH